jgi:hypothetical protein
MISMVPEIRWQEWRKYFSPEVPVFAPWLTSKKQKLYTFSRSSWSLATLCHWHLQRSGQEKMNLWLPGYFCFQALAGIDLSKVNLIYYPIREDLSPDWSWCKKNVSERKADVFLLVHFFGLRQESREFQKIFGAGSTYLVEDSTHVLHPGADFGKNAHFSLYSPYKFFAIPDGAFLITNHLSEEEQTSFDDYYQKHVTGQQNAGKWLIKNVVKKVLPNDLLRRLQRVRFEFSQDAPAGTLPAHRQMSVMARNYLSHLTVADLETHEKKRSEASSLNSMVLKLNQWRSPFVDNGKMYATLGKVNDRAEEAFLNLNQRGIPCAPWPDLPPAVRGNPAFPVENDLRRSLLLFPLAPRNQRAYLRYFVQKIAAFITARNLKLEASGMDLRAWNEAIGAIPKSNMLQEWHYGEAKKSEGNIPLRYELRLEQRTVGLVQVLKKKLPKIPASLYRVNRAPLFFPGYQDSVIQFAALKQMAGHFSKWKIRPLFIAPEMPHDLATEMILKKLGFFNYSKARYRSSWLSLALSEEQLRKNLQQKWRNTLNAAEKNGLSLRISSRKEDLQWLIERYKELMASKQFQGTPVHLIEALYLNDANTNFFIAIADFESSPCAAVLIALHGNSATYLVGWNGETGRNLKANHFLLWNSMRELQKRGFAWFDVGGMDEKNLPMITSFKEGLGGDDYRLCGEWLR